MKSNGTFKPFGSAKGLGITPKITGHDMIAKCDCGEKFSYQNSKKDILWQCPECNGMKKLDATKMADGGAFDDSTVVNIGDNVLINDKAEEVWARNRKGAVLDMQRVRTSPHSYTYYYTVEVDYTEEFGEPHKSTYKIPQEQIKKVANK